VDLTERRSLESQFRQAQKLESIGQLAGGVAHDFNNLLTVILGYSEMMLEEMDVEDPYRAAAEQIAKAGKRAAELTHQLLTFSRQSTFTPRAIRFDDLIPDVKVVLNRLIGSHIEVIYSAGAESALIHADPSQIQQIMVNLAVNSRDAMPEGGTLLIESALIDVSDEFSALCLSAPQGRYLSLRVTDTGTGMTPEVKARLFDPFFTTKEAGQGTGLGLSAVYGIVKQCRGTISVHSTPGLGTSIRILFPALDDGRAPESPEAPEADAEGTETVLLVEDETGVRDFIRGVLEGHGYRALGAARGIDAIEIARRHDGPIHLLLTDVVLPGMNGTEVVRQFVALRPGIPVLLMSGYPQRFGTQLNQGIPHLQKPFSSHELLKRMREIFDAPPATIA
jgi:two-component system cell cycle sensor histidine kinase/response regulator CckA